MAEQRAELECDQAPECVAVERRVQRIGLGVMTLFAIGGAMGLFGDGALSTASARAGSLDVTYQRFTRQSVRSTIIIEAASADVARIGFEKAFVEQLEIHETRPVQLEMEHEADQVVFLVPATDGVARLVLRVEPLQSGVHRTRVTTQGGGSVELRQIVFF